MASKGRSNRGEKRASENRAFARNVTLGLVVVGGLLALVVMANRWSNREVIKSIAISGNEVLDSTEIAALLGVEEGTSLSQVDLAELEGRVIDHPFIKGGVIWKGTEGLVLDVEERSPVAVTIMRGRAVYLDDRGVPLPFRFGVATPDVPVLDGVLEGEEIDSARVAEGIRVATLLREYGAGLDHRISTIQRSRSGEYSFRLVDGDLLVRVGPKEEVRSRLPKLEAFLNHVLLQEGTARFGTIDLRWRGQVVAEVEQEA